MVFLTTEAEPIEAESVFQRGGRWWQQAAQSGKDLINTRALGTQDPTLIFVHGYTCALDDWDAQVNALSPRFRCAALDLPGHGVSAKPEAVSIATMGSAVKQVKEQVGARATILVGNR